jgi:hypothetical protein
MSGDAKVRLSLGLLSFPLVLLSGDVLSAQPVTKDACLACHSVPGMQKTRDGKNLSLQIDKDTFDQSIHRAFECTTCHSDISELPYIKRQAVHALSQNYSNKENARESIATALDAFYLKQYPKVHEVRRDAIKKAISEVQKIYQTNIFPEMKVDWGTHPDNIGDTLYPGCFRCHEGNHVSREGKVLRKDCQLCHTIIGQETALPKPTEVAATEKFHSPMAIIGKTRTTLLQSVSLARQRIIVRLHDLPHTAGGSSHGRAALRYMPPERTSGSTAYALCCVPS